MEDINDYYILYLLDNADNSLSIRAKFYFDKTELKQKRIDILNNGKPGSGWRPMNSEIISLFA